MALRGSLWFACPNRPLPARPPHQASEHKVPKAREPLFHATVYDDDVYRNRRRNANQCNGACCELEEEDAGCMLDEDEEAMVDDAVASEEIVWFTVILSAMLASALLSSRTAAEPRARPRPPLGQGQPKPAPRRLVIDDCVTDEEYLTE